ncbi:histidine phosphatase family protein [Ideonella sp.]|uniref:histidine phosphatase family protein n=1 Tax=Ideonella sp. TaxID=1929293 RepID=UPI002B487642|nr:histidine phosphatase family protein [Ideonella sp.]HJV68657.1 histidine phosphatase family protein [Ideonella sp.]
MGTLYLVRHGQASFGSHDYDRLSELGHRQCRALGEHFRSMSLSFDLVLTGTLRRHRETYEGIAEGLGSRPEPEAWPGLNEYDPEAIVRAVHSGPIAAPKTPEAVRQHFRLLREGLVAWMQGRSEPAGMPSYADFAAGVGAALARARERADADVLIVSSGGPISIAVGLVLGLAPDAVAELNLRIRNSAVTEFVASPKRHSLLSFNGLPHLHKPELADWVTYA